MSREQSRKEGRRGPESAAWDKLKGGPVDIEWMKDGRPDTTALLLWVDYYTIGLRMPGGSEPIVFKHAIATIAEASGV